MEKDDNSSEILKVLKMEEPGFQSSRGIRPLRGETPFSFGQRNVDRGRALVEGMEDDENRLSVGGDPTDGLPSSRMAPIWTEVAKASTGALFDDGSRQPVKSHGGDRECPLVGGEPYDIPGEAHATKKGRREAVS